MSPALTALARDYMALPGAPAWDVRADHWRILDAARRYDDGIRWLRIDSDWLPDLTDASTGGSILPLLGPGWLVYQRMHDGVWEVSRFDGAQMQEGATLAEAVARVAVAVGRAG